MLDNAGGRWGILTCRYCDIFEELELDRFCDLLGADHGTGMDIDIRGRRLGQSEHHYCMWPPGHHAVDTQAFLPGR